MKNQICEALMHGGGGTNARFKQIILNLWNDGIYKEVELYGFLCSCDDRYRDMFFWLLHEVSKNKGNSTRLFMQEFYDLVNQSKRE